MLRHYSLTKINHNFTNAKPIRRKAHGSRKLLWLMLRHRNKESQKLGLVQRIANNVQLMMRRPLRQQYAALCYRIPNGSTQPEVLLLTSRETRRWVIPKGWPMEGKKAHAVAEREAYEEAGVKGTVEPATFGHFDYDKKLRSGLVVTCRVEVHLLKVSKMCSDFPEKADRDLAWVSPAEAAERVNEPELKALIKRFAQSFAK